MARRRLAYVEYGDPGGRPVIYCHGFPSSGREARLLHTAARAEGARIIAPDRPGYGRSDYQPNRTMPDWSHDVEVLADHLSLSRFSLLGVSGGGPYALVCASILAQRIEGCALVCALGPVYLAPVLRQMGWTARFNLGMARYAPLFSEILLGPLTAGLLSAWPRSIGRLRRINASGADLEALADPRTRRILDQTVEDALRDGARGARQDLALYLRDWGIPLAEIALRIDLWHGEEDGIVPVSHTQWYSSHLHRARVHRLANEGHYSLPLRHCTTILRSLLAQAEHREST